MTETLANNAWVESYLDALLSKGGLSNEHVAAAGNSPGARGVGGARGGEGGGMFDALMDDEERSITARYYVHQILSLDEERIRDAWSKASRPAKSGGLTAERDARMEHLSWRVWAMKRRRAQVDATLQDAARQAASDAMMAEADEDEADATTLQTIDDLNFATAGDSEDVEDEEVEGESELMGDEEEEGEEGEELSTGNGSGVQAPGQHLLSTAVRRVIASSRRQRPPSGAPSQTPPLSEADSGRASASTRGASSSTPTASAPAATTPPGGRLPSGSDGGAAAPGFPGLSPFASTPQSPFSTTPRAGARPTGGAALGVGGGAGNGPAGREGAAGPRMVSPPPTPPPTANASGQLSGAPSLRQAPSAAGSGTQSMAPPTPPLTALQPPATPLQPAGGSGTVGTLSAAAAAGPPAPLGASTPPPDPLLVSRFPRLYILLISMHGLVRGEKMELGKDPDTGGQVKYVVELAKALARFPSVARVDLLTRLIKDPKVDPSYGVEQEPLTISGLPPPPPASAEPCCPPAAPLAPAGQSGELGGQSGSAATASGSSPRGAYIVRLAAGDPALYLRKEELWPHLREFADRAIAHASATLAKLQEGGEGPCELYMVHGHYADAGEVAALVAHTLGVDCMLTGHSLGRNKREHLLKSGTVSFAEVEATYAMSRRIEAEERALDAASVVFTSTQQEVAEQWGAYDGYSDELSAALQLRPCKGYHVPRMAVIPPGLDFSNLKVSLSQDPWEAVLGPLAAAPPALPPANSSRSNSRGGAPPTLQDSALANPPPSAAAGPGQGPGGVAPDAASTASGVSSSHSEGGAGPLAPAPHASPSGKTPSSLLAAGPEPPLWREVARFLRHPGKPVILAMCRPDPKKNILGLLHAYGRSRLLRELANLVLVLGNRDIIDSMAPGSARVMADVLKLIDAYDLYGCVAYPKKHSQADISDIYLLAAATRGVFVNAALQEPFGLTLIEAAAHGVPIVATTHGGPVDIVATLRNGVLVDPNNIRSITEACTSLITSPRTWDELSESGRRNITAYSWPSHCARALRTVEDQKATQLAASRSRLGGFMGAAGFGGPTSGTTHGPNSFTSNNKNVGVHATGHTVTTMRHTLSLSFDDLASLARAIASNPNISSAAVITEAVTSAAAAAAAPTIATGVAAAAAAGGGGGVGGGLTGKGAKHPSFTAGDRAGGFAAEGGGGEPVEAEQASGLARRSIELARANRAGSLPAAALHKLFGSSRRLLGGVGAPAGTRAGPGGRGGLGGAGEGLLSPSSGNGGKTSKVGLQVSVRGPSLLSGGAAGSGAKEGVTEAGGGVTEGGSGVSGLTRAGSGAGGGGSASGLRRAGSGSRGSSKSGGAGGATAAAAKAALGAAGGTLPGGLISSLRGLGGALLGGGSAGKLAMSTVAEASDAEEAAAAGGAAAGGAAAGGAAAGKGEAGLGRALESGTYSGSLHNHTPRMCHHERFVVVTIDSLADVPQAAALIRALLEAGSDAASQDATGGSFPAAARDAVLKGWATGAAGELGVGVACTWSAQEMRALLEEQGVDPRELDFMVCNAGSLIWHTTADPTHSASSPNLAALATSPPRPTPGSERADRGGSGHMAVAGALFACDDEWERHLDMRWDERVVGQVLRRIIATKVGWGKLAISRGPAGAAGPAPVPVKGTGIAAAAAAAAASQQAGRAGSAVEGAEGEQSKVVGKVGGGGVADPTDKYRALAPASATEAQGEAAAAAVEPPTPAAAVAAPGPGPAPQAEVTSPQLASPSSDPAAVAGKAGGQGAAASPAAAAAGGVSTPVSLQLSPCSTPLHFMMHADILPQPTVAAGGKAARGTMGTGDVALNLLGTVRRKLRMSGLRTQLVAAAHDSLSGTSPEGGVTLHITPLRCSRALAIRHLAHRFKKPLDSSWTVVAFAANHSPATDKSFAPDASLAHGTASGWVVTPSSGAVSEAGSMGRRASASVSAVARPPAVEVVGLRASDGEDLVSGVQRVVLVPSFASPGAQRQKGAASARCTFPVDIVVHGSQVRVQQVNAGGESAAEGANSSSRLTVLVPS